MKDIYEVYTTEQLNIAFTKAKITADKFNYKISTRIIPVDDVEQMSKYDIFCKTNFTEITLCEKLGLDVEYQYMPWRNDLKLEKITPKEDVERHNLYVMNLVKSGASGYFIQYNNLMLNWNTLVSDVSYLMYPNNTKVSSEIPLDTAAYRLKTDGYFEGLISLHMRCIATDSIIPYLLYLMTCKYKYTLPELVDLKPAVDDIAKGKAPLPFLLEAVPLHWSGRLVEPYTCTYLAPTLNSDNETAYENLCRLGMYATFIYGCEVLYQWNQIEDEYTRNAIMELFLVDLKDNSFVAKYLYNKDGLVETLVACFDKDNEARFNAFSNYFDTFIKASNYDKEFVYDVKDNAADMAVPLIFARFINGMHQYAVQVCRVKHAQFVYLKAKEAGVINKDDFTRHCMSAGGKDDDDEEYEDADEEEDTELLHLDTDDYSDSDASKSEFEDDKVKRSVSKTLPSLDAADVLKRDLHDSIYDFEVNYISPSISYKPTYDSIATAIKMTAVNLIKQIREIKTYNFGGKNTGMRSGKLDPKNLWKYKTSNNIFYNNTYKIKEMDLAFGCILDESGSMYGNNIKNGRIAMILLHEVLTAVGVNHSIIGHTSHHGHQSIINKYFQFKEEKHYSLKVPYNLAAINAKSGNCDSGALYYMQSCMKQVRNKDKIVLIFSDGQPTECTDKELRDQVAKMEANGIHVIGIGINFPSIKEYYPDNANGKNLQEMVNIIVSILKRYVLEKKE